MARLGRGRPNQRRPTARPVAAAFPQVSTLTDDFSSSTNWTLITGGTVTGGQLVLPTTTGFAGAASVGQYTLVGSSASVELVQTGGTAASQTHFYLDAGSGYDVRFQILGSTMYATYKVGGVESTPASVAYNPAVHRFLRLSESAGDVYWDWSTDGNTWTNLNITNWSVAGILVDTIRPTFFSGYNGTGATPADSVFDNFNLLPPPPTTVTPDLASSTPSALSPAVTTTVTVTPDAAASSPSTFAPTLSATVTVTPGLASSTATALAPAVSTTVTVTPDLASATATAYPPALSATVTVTPGTATSSPTAYAPNVVSGSTAIPATAGSAATSYPPTVTTTVTIAPTLAGAAATAAAPTLTSIVVIIPGTAASTATAHPPTAAAGDTYFPHNYVTATITGYTPAAAVLAGVGAGTAVLAANGVGTAVLAITAPGMAVIDTTGSASATLLSDGQHLAELAPETATAVIDTT